MLFITKSSRLLHQYLGIFGILFFIILSVSGIALMHADTLNLKDKMVDQKFIPDKYFEVQKPNSIKVRAIYNSPKNFDEILVGTNLGIFKTIDGGKNWSEANQGLYNLDVSVIRRDPFDSEILYCGTEKGIFKSINGGESWDEWFEETAGLEHTNITDLALDPAIRDKIFAAVQNEIFLSEDGGESWEEVFEDMPLKEGGRVSSLYIIPGNSDAIYAGTDSGLFRTIDGGHSWEGVQKELLNQPILSVFSPNNNPTHIFAGTGSGLIQSFESGKTWQRSLENKSIRLITNYSGRDNELIIATGNELFKSTDSGQSWEDINKKNDKDLVINTVNFSGPSKSKILAGTNKGLFSIDKENNWEPINLNIPKDDRKTGPMEMKLLKLATEIHTGRFFGNYFSLIFDIASVALIITSISGLYIYFIRAKIRKRHKEKIEKLDKVDLIMDFNEKTQEISKDSNSIHDLAEHIKEHVLACKSIVQNGNANEIKKVEVHINSIDKKLHHLLSHLKDASMN